MSKKKKKERKHRCKSSWPLMRQQILKYNTKSTSKKEKMNLKLKTFVQKISTEWKNNPQIYSKRKNSKVSLSKDQLDTKDSKTGMRLKSYITYRKQITEWLQTPFNQ